MGGTGSGRVSAAEQKANEVAAAQRRGINLFARNSQCVAARDAAAADYSAATGTSLASLLAVTLLPKSLLGTGIKWLQNGTAML